MKKLTMGSSHRLVRVALVVSGGRILRGVILWTVLAIVLWVVAVVLLWIVSRLVFLSAASKEAPLRWRGVLVRVALLLVIWDKGHVRPRNPPPPAHAKSKEDRDYDHEANDCDGNTCSGAQPFPANDITEANGGGQPRPG